MGLSEDKMKRRFIALLLVALMALATLSSAMVVGAQLLTSQPPKEVLKKGIIGPNGKTGGQSYIIVTISSDSSSATFNGKCEDPLIKPDIPYCLQLSTYMAGQSQHTKGIDQHTKGIDQSQASAKDTLGNAYSLQCTATKDPGVIRFAGTIQDHGEMSLLTTKPQDVIFKVI